DLEHEAQVLQTNPCLHMTQGHLSTMPYLLALDNRKEWHRNRKDEQDGPMPALTLVSHHLCPYVQRAVIALLEKGVPFERVYINLDEKPAWFRQISPLGKVPLLKVGDEAVLFES